MNNKESHDNPHLNDISQALKSIREVVAEKAGKLGNKGDRMFSMYCFILEHSTGPHGWTPPMSLISIAGKLNKRERTIHLLMKEMVEIGLIERDTIGGVYRYKLLDLEISYGDERNKTRNKTEEVFSESFTCDICGKDRPIEEQTGDGMCEDCLPFLSLRPLALLLN